MLLSILIYKQSDLGKISITMKRDLIKHLCNDKAKNKRDLQVKGKTAANTSRHIKLIKEHYNIKNENTRVTVIIIYENSLKFYCIQHLEPI